MKKLLEYVNIYVDRYELKDFALLKICLCAMGVIIGLSIPEKKKRCPLVAAIFVFAFSYVLLMAQFVKVYMEVRQEKYFN